MIIQTFIKGTLYLIPTPLSVYNVPKSVSELNKTVIESLRCFVVEENRTAWRFLRKIDPKFPINQSRFFVLNEHTQATINLQELVQPLHDGEDVGLLSEVGFPCIADPGSNFVKAVQEANLRVVPLAGHSSIFMALMASGLGGQNFTFHGYLPIDKTTFALAIQKLEQNSARLQQTQIFIETPYRNDDVLQILVEVCHSDTMLCVASNISQPDEYIKTKPIRKWRTERPTFHKKPTVYVFLATPNLKKY
jgi:16S rRNA (cytidine1402-2'-O)-methyltransferase